MRNSAILAISVAALLALSGCTGLVATNADEKDPSPDEFPNASSLDSSVYDTHAALLENTSFTVSIEQTTKRPDATNPDQFTYFNSSNRILVEPGDPQYLAQPNGTQDYLGSAGLLSLYSDGEKTYLLGTKDDETTVKVQDQGPQVLNSSSDRYLWGTLGSEYWVFHRNVTFERAGVETFQGVPVMRYEATGVDALPESYRAGASEFSSTMRIDQEGVVREYRYELNQTVDGEVHHDTRVYTVSAVGSTDVETPEWASNATAGS